MTKRVTIFLVLVVFGSLLLLGTTNAQQQQTDKSTQGTSTSKQKSDKSSSMQSDKKSMSVHKTDQDFMKKAAEGGMAEVALGELAAKQGSSEDVKHFGQRMVDDHSKANRELMDLASQKGVTLPTEPNAQQKAEKAKMEKLSGANFDREYMRAMVKDHDKDVAEFEKQSRTAHDADLKAWAGKTLPTLQEHKKMAHDVAGKVGAGKSASNTVSKKDTK